MDNKTNTTSVFHSLNSSSANGLSIKVIGIFLVVIALGLFTGYKLASSALIAIPTAKTTTTTTTGGVQKGAVYGTTDTSTFKDTAEGTVAAGGIDGEGQYHLVRPGGDSQNVYMTSSLVDLSTFIGRKIKVWGQTQTAKKAGWLMDVGRVEVEQ